MHSTVIVCTRNRPEEMGRLVDALPVQSVKPRLVVVDSSDNTSTRRIVETFAEAGVWSDVLYVPSEPGLTRQRMRGIAELSADCEVVHFIDDDVAPEPGYFSALEAALDIDTGAVGAGGVITNLEAHRARLLNRVFLLDSLRGGVILESGVNVKLYHADEVTPVQWLSGCSMSYRRTVFDHVSFDTRMSGYSLGEDVDFSYRAGALGRLLVVPKARIAHLERGAQTFDRRSFARAEVVRRHAFVAGNARRGVSPAAFWWSVLGDYAVTLGKSLVFADPAEWRAKLQGLADGLGDIRRERGVVR